MSKSSRIATNAITTWLASAARAVVGLAIVPFLIIELGPDGYGLTAVVASIVTFSAIADLGLRLALSRELSAARARRDSGEGSAIASTGFALYLVIGTGLALACGLFASTLADAFNVPTKLAAEGVFLIRWYGSGIVLASFLAPVFAAVLASENRFDLINGCNLIQGLGGAGAVFVILSASDLGLYGWAAGMGAAHLARLILLRKAASACAPYLTISVRAAARSRLKGLLSLSGMLYVMQMSDLIGVQSDPLIITAFLGPAAVALYAPAASLAGALRPFVRTIAGQLQPLATSSHTVGRTGDLQQILVRGTRYTVLLGAPVSAALVVFSFELARVWLEPALGESYRITGWVILVWGVIEMSRYAGGTQWPIFLGTNKIRLVVVLTASTALANIAMSIFLTQHTRLGVLAAVIPTAAFELVQRPILIGYAARVVGLSPRTYLSRAYGRPSVVAAGMLGVALTARLCLAPFSMTELLGVGVLMGAAWLPMTWWVGFTTEDRQAFRALGRRGLQRASGFLKR